MNDRQISCLDGQDLPADALTSDLVAVVLPFSCCDDDFLLCCAALKNEPDGSFALLGQGFVVFLCNGEVGEDGACIVDLSIGIILWKVEPRTMCGDDGAASDVWTCSQRGDHE